MQNAYQKQPSANKIGFWFVFVEENNAPLPVYKASNIQICKKTRQKSTPQGAFPEHPFL
jgi:hypothetical protein